MFKRKEPSQYLEYVGEVPEVEDVVEFDGCWQEGGGDLLVESCRQGTGVSRGQVPGAASGSSIPEPLALPSVTLGQKDKRGALV